MKRALENIRHRVQEFSNLTMNYETATCLDGNSNNSGSSDDKPSCPILQSKHNIFLSHSGAQKDFVERLCEDLENRRRYPFFDKRPSSLPKGERFPKLILEAAQQCKMAIVVVSEEYFTSKWPMIELNTFVKALSRSNSELKILPLFFGLSASDCSDPSRQVCWFSKWDKWAKNDARIKPKEFKNALKVMLNFNGVEFNQGMREVGTYQRVVLSHICNAISPNIKWDDSHVQGRSNMCEAVREKIQETIMSSKHKVCIIGYYGIGGIGKTTMCKTLCNELSEFEGKVCHIELAANRSLVELLKEVLKNLTSTSEELLQQLNEGECQNILQENISWKEKIFLAIDNVWDDSKSIEQVQMFLQAPFHEGSVLMVTSRSHSTLAYLGIDGSKCFEVPELGEVDARNLFLYHAAKGKQFTSKEDNHFIAECVGRCYFQKGEKQGYHYLPLALKALGMQLGCLGNNPVEWKKGLSKVRNFNYFCEQNPVFGILRLNFDRLQAQEQTLFMDIALYCPLNSGSSMDGVPDLIRWLSLVHRQKLEDSENQVQRLKEKGLLEDVDISSQKLFMHDLYREFAVMEAQGKLNSSSFNSRRWMYWDAHPSDLEMTPSGRCWENLIRVIIQQEYGADDAILSFQGVQWRYCSNVMVLKLVGLYNLNGVLNLKDLKCLRSLYLKDLRKLERLEGLEDLNSLTYFQWEGNCLAEDMESRRSLGQLPASLQILDLQIPGSVVYLRRDVFSRCTNLHGLNLCFVCADEGLDFRNFQSLQTIQLGWIQGPLQNLSGLGGGLSSACLQSLSISECRSLRSVSGLDHLVGLQNLYLSCNYELKKLPDLQKLTNLQTLRIKHADIAEVPGLGKLRQLRALSCSQLLLSELPNLSGLKQLHHLNLSHCSELTTLEGLGDLPALRRLDLDSCFLLLRLPDLSKSTNLHQLDISWSAIELQEEDIGMLAKLLMLRPVYITYYPAVIRLDMVKRKVLKCRSDGTVKEERGLELPPIKVYDYKF